MSGISLTSSMRNNLLSLQQTAKLQDLTQNRLATGLKVNSAIDNPSSYYTAQSLNNRADDLNILLDAMSQGIQTLKAVNESLEAGTKFLEQAKSVANSALETALPVVAKVSTEAELLAAIDSGKEGLIVLTSDITMSTNQNIVLNDGQSLVGARYLDKNAVQTKLSFNFDEDKANNAIITGNNSLISDLDIYYTTTFGQEKMAGIYANGKIGVKVQNINFEMTNTDPQYLGFFAVSAIMGINSAAITLDGEINFSGHGRRVLGVFAHQASQIDINGKIGALVNEDTQWIFWSHSQSMINFNENSVSNINFQSGNDALMSTSNAYINIRKNAAISVTSKSADNFNWFYNEYSKGTNPNFKEGNGYLFEAGSKISHKNDIIGVDNEYLTSHSFHWDIENWLPEFSDLSAQFDIIGNAQTYERKETLKNSSQQTQFNQILSQYDQLIKDSWYKGVNLLKGQDLKVVFNESRSADLEIIGVDASAKGLGLKQAAWNNAAGVQESLKQIDSAINQLRLYASEFGNYYQIVTTRENFTNSLINVLTEGADALTLADMNQESANMLALQTRQQLAVNSLSLASQASQSVLKLF